MNDNVSLITDILPPKTYRRAYSVEDAGFLMGRRHQLLHTANRASEAHDKSSFSNFSQGYLYAAQLRGGGGREGRLTWIHQWLCYRLQQLRQVR